MKIYYFFKKLIIIEYLENKNEPGEGNAPFKFKKTLGQEHEAASVEKTLHHSPAGGMDGNQT